MRSGDRSSAAPAFVHVPELGAPDSTIALSPDESHYVARVCRARPGEWIEATDGRGGIARLQVESIDSDVRARVERVEQVARARRAWLLCGAPEGKRDDWMVEKLAELGVERWIPLDCSRGRWDGLAQRRARWDRLTIAALKQSRSAFRMEIGEPLSPRDAAARVPAGAVRVLARAGVAAIAGLSHAAFVAGAIGPAGGFDEREEAEFDSAGFRPVGLGPSRLRTETAAMALAVAALIQP